MTYDWELDLDSSEDAMDSDEDLSEDNCEEMSD